MVYNLALQYAQNTEDAEEITQDVFLTIYRSLDGFRHESKMSTWIYRIGINKSIDFVKARRRKKRFTLLTSQFQPGSADEIAHSVSFDHPGVKLEQKEALSRLFMYINELPDQQRTALILHKIEQKSQVEAAEIMEISPKALESLVQRAKVSLKKKMQNNPKDKPFNND